MTQAPAFLIQGNNIILVLGGKSHTISKDSHMNYDKIVDALKSQQWDNLSDLVEPKKAIINFGKGNVTIDGDELLWKGEAFNNALSRRMIDMYTEGFSIDPMIKFMDNLMKNPSKRSVTQLYGFMEKNNMPITEDGYLLAYKKVKSDYTDLHTGNFDNSVGQIVEMERNTVDDNPDQTCSTGLHFCSESYLSGFGSATDPVMILKINPADVVSIPSDYNGAKGRCCKYEVVAEVHGDPKDAFTSSVCTRHSINKPTQVTGATRWPFPTAHISAFDEGEFDAEDSQENKDDQYADEGCESDEDQLYDLVRVYGGQIEYCGLTYEEACEKRDKNNAQKKAKLTVVKSYI